MGNTYSKYLSASVDIPTDSLLYKSRVETEENDENEKKEKRTYYNIKQSACNGVERNY